MAVERAFADEEAAEFPVAVGGRVRAEDERDLPGHGSALVVADEQRILAAGQAAQADGHGDGAIGIGAEKLGVRGRLEVGRVEQIGVAPGEFAALDQRCRALRNPANAIPIAGDGG
jgi:hypothetical protein